MITDDIRAFLQHRVQVEKRDVGVVVGIVDEHGSSIVSYGTMDDGTSQEVNGDTLFEIGSITKTFTALLLQDMIERGEMKLDDPVAKYLPKSAKMPTHNGKEITLFHLVTHTSGLPRNPENLDPKSADNPLAEYTVEKLNACLSGYQLTRNPGAKFEYSNLGSGLLGHVISLKAGTDYESLVTDRICRPSKMDSTRIKLTPELKARFATGHNQFGYAVSSMDFRSQAGCGALRSTANDLLKYVAANIGLTPSSLTTLMEKTHLVRFQSVIPPVNVALAWGVVLDPQGRKIVSHGGATYGYRAFAGFDKTRRRGVVVLSNSSYEGVGPDSIGMLLLESEWQSNRRPKATEVSNQVYDSYLGQYRLSPNFNLGILIMRLILRNASKAFIWIPAGICLAVIFVFLWCVANWIVLGCAALFGGLLAALSVLVLSWVVCARFQPAIGIRREGDRIFAQATRLWHITLKLLPYIYGVNVKLSPGPAISLSPVTFELLPESETRFFERMSGIPMTFCHDGYAKVTRLTAHIPGTELSFKKISNQPPKAPEPSKPRAFIKLDTKFYDAYVGQYEFAPGAAFPTGIKLTIWQQGDQLVGQALGRNGGGGEFEIYPESETDFFLKINGAQLTFIKNDKGEVTAIIHRIAGLPDSEGKKLKNLSE
jgi:D-alanyl-D-alanine-carboxypeptidase/D-alanyl-D-alanine-endopeptidase